MTPGRRSGEIRKLNTLRGLAALIVVLGHFSNHAPIPGAMLLAGSGQFGVMLFFLLSGFLMGYLYLDQVLDGVALQRFAMARIARVVPLYVFVVLASWLLIRAGYPDALYPIPGTRAVLVHLLFLRGTSVLWTIPPEMQFYVLFTGFWWLWRQRPAAMYLLLAALVGALWYLEFPRPQSRLLGLPWDFALPQTLSYFAVGVTLGSLFGKLRLPAAWVRPANALALLLIPLLYPEIFSALTGASHRLWQSPGVLLAVSLIFFVVVFLVPDDTRWLSNRAGDYLGRISYSLYLWHLPVLLAVKPWVSLYPWPSLVGFLLLSLLAAELSWRLLESPCRRGLRVLMLEPARRG